MVYDRTHTRDLAELHELNLSRAIPFAAVIFTLAGMASMGLPGFSGFIAELQVLIGAWQASPTIAVIAGLGIVVGVAYTLRALQQAFFSGSGNAATNSSRARADADRADFRAGANWRNDFDRKFARYWAFSQPVAGSDCGELFLSSF